MKTIILTAFVAVLFSGPAAAGYYGYGYGYRHSCGNYDRLASDYRRLQRDYDSVRRQLNGQARSCQSSLAQQQQAFQTIINQHRGLNAELISQSSDTTALVTAIAEEKGIPEDLLNRPTREEFEDLEERYQRLLRAYRNLERDHRELTRQ